MTTAEKLVAALKARGWICGTAESCTGGGIGRAITDVAGASSVFWGGIICYDNSVKHRLLGVSTEILEGVGSVSGTCAEQMASGVRTALAVDLGVSVTGLAGPGGDGVNPAGCVWFGLASKAGVRSEKVVFTGDRAAVRAAAVEHALELLLKAAS